MGSRSELKLPPILLFSPPNMPCENSVTQWSQKTLKPTTPGTSPGKEGLQKRFLPLGNGLGLAVGGRLGADRSGWQADQEEG